MPSWDFFRPSISGVREKESGSTSLLPCPPRSGTMCVVRIPVSALLAVGKRLQVRVFSARFVTQVALREKMPDKKPFSRLPKDVIPKNYAIRLKPDLSKLTFEGQQAITVQVVTRCGFAVVGVSVHVCTRRTLTLSCCVDKCVLVHAENSNLDDCHVMQFTWWAGLVGTD